VDYTAPVRRRRAPWLYRRLPPLGSLLTALAVTTSV
jgi:hypothetical protein